MTVSNADVDTSEEVSGRAVAPGSAADCVTGVGASELAADDMGPRVKFWNAYCLGEGNHSADLCARGSDYRNA
jgi:hypothetical protein